MVSDPASGGGRARRRRPGWFAGLAVVGLVVAVAVAGAALGHGLATRGEPNALVPGGPSPPAGPGTISPPSPDLGRLRGITIGGADFGAGKNIGIGTGDAFSNDSPGRLWTRERGGTYTYPDPASLRYLAGRGIGVVRLTFRWERLQPDLNGELDPDELALIDAAIDAADQAGLEVIPVLMNYGAYWEGEGDLGVRRPIGSPQIPVATFARTWGLVAQALAHHDNIAAYGLMNEPVDVVGGAPTWELASTEAAKAIRATGDATVIAVPTYQWSNVHRVADQHPAGPWLDDTLGPVIYEVHQYFSAARSGSYQSYSQELQAARDEGWPATGDIDALTQRSVSELQEFVAWLNGRPGWVGEVGWPNDADVGKWNTLAQNWFAAANSAQLWVTVWTTGSLWPNDYPLLAYRSSRGASGPLDSTTPTAAVLEDNL
jgi:endoglucanase